MSIRIIDFMTPFDKFRQGSITAGEFRRSDFFPSLLTSDAMRPSVSDYGTANKGRWNCASSLESSLTKNFTPLLSYSANKVRRCLTPDSVKLCHRPLVWFGTQTRCGRCACVF